MEAQDQPSPENIQSNTPEHQSWIQETSMRSWEPELVISGVAIYITSNLPVWLSWLMSYYTFHFISDSESKVYILTELIFTMLTSIVYLLSFTFVFHFTLRAFWVGMVGLNSVYPDGIRYEKLTSYSDYYIEQFKKRMDSMAIFILNLDKLCSMLFSVSFMFVMLLLGICWMYSVMLMIISVLRFFMTPDEFRHYEFFVYFALMGVFIIFSIISSILNTKSLRGHPVLKVWHFKITWYFGKLFFPIVYIPLNYILFTFISQLSRKQLFNYGLFVLFYMVAMFFMADNSLVRFFEYRDFFSSNSAQYLIDSQHYEDKLHNTGIIHSATIQSKVIKDDYLELFIPHPKNLDVELKNFCKSPTIPDSLNRQKKRDLKSQYSLRCVQEFFRIQIDDSVYTTPEFIFYQSKKPMKKGFLTLMPLHSLKPGRHVLKILPPMTDSTQKKEYLHALPFWYRPTP